MLVVGSFMCVVVGSPSGSVLRPTGFVVWVSEVRPDEQMLVVGSW